MSGGTGERSIGTSGAGVAVAGGSLEKFGGDDDRLCKSSAICSCSFNLLLGRSVLYRVFGENTDNACCQLL